MSKSLCCLSNVIAFPLNNNQYSMSLLAQEQVGGRVHTEIINGFPFDHGAQFVHSERGSALYDYAARNGLLLNLPSFKDEEGFPSFFFIFIFDETFKTNI